MKGRGPLTRKAGRAEIFRKGLRIRGLEESGTILNGEFKAPGIALSSARRIIQVLPQRTPPGLASMVSIASSSANHSGRFLRVFRRGMPRQGLNRFFVSESFRSVSIPCPESLKLKKSQSLLRQRI